MSVKFYELAVGARFSLRGERFKKVAMSCATDERGWANLFLGSTEIEPEGEPLLLSPEEAARWKPSAVPWTEALDQIFHPKAG